MKLVAGLLGVMLLIAAISFVAWRSAPQPPPCTEVPIRSSTNGRNVADAFEKRCGDSVSTHVALRTSSSPVASHADVFVAAGRVKVELSWNERDELVIESPAKHVLIEESHWRKVGVRVRRVR